MTFAYFNQYINFFLTPFKMQKQWAVESTDNSDIAFVHSLYFSWVLTFIRASYTLLFVYLISYYSPTINNLIEIKLTVTKNKLLLYFLLFEVVIFPITVWVTLKIWTYVIKLFHHLYNDESNFDRERIKQIVNGSLSSHLFFLIPVLGRLGQKISSLFYIFAGLRCNLGWTRAQSFIVILAPVIIMSTAAFFLILLMILNFSTLILGF
jgi:hypothetical protein